MTDGPFKNLKLTASQKKVVEALENDAFAVEERGDRICHAILNGLADAGDLKLVSALNDLAQKDQFDLDERGVIDEFFDGFGKTPFSDKLQQELTYQIEHGFALKDGMNRALPSAIDRQTYECSNRIKDELLRSRVAGDASRKQVADAIENLHQATAALPVNDIYEAVLEENKNAFKEKSAKKRGKDEGPQL